MNPLLIIITALLAFSCTCEQKLNRLVKKCPSLIKGDTITIHDTIVVNGVQKDTIFHYLQKDTVIIKEGGLTMRYYYNTHDSTIYLSGKCDTVFVPVKYEIPTNTIISEDSGFNWWIVSSIGLALLIIFLIVRSR